MSRVKIATRLCGVLAALLLSGCRILEAPTTPAPIIVTATPFPVTPTATDTPSGPTRTPTPVLGPIANITTSPRPLPTATKTPLPTSPPTLTPSFTPTFTESPARVPTVNVGACGVQPQGGFATIYNRDAALRQALGCAIGPAVPVGSAVQDFESGRMVWAAQLADVPQRAIYAVYNSGQYGRYNDTWTEGVDPINHPGSEGAPPGRQAPIRGFGKVWIANGPVRSGLGWAIGPETGTGGQMQRFERGEMFFVASLNQTFIFANGTWRLDPTPF